jgi:hypothetical protein
MARGVHKDSEGIIFAICGLVAPVRYVEARPQRMYETFFQLVIEALHDAWPCPPSTEFDKRYSRDIYG